MTRFLLLLALAGCGGVPPAVADPDAGHNPWNHWPPDVCEIQPGWLPLQVVQPLGEPCDYVEKQDRAVVGLLWEYGDPICPGATTSQPDLYFIGFGSNGTVSAVRHVGVVPDCPGASWPPP